MAIEFSCPYCTAVIRVEDTAAGKQGLCPKCQTRLIVPNAPRPPESPPASDPADPTTIPTGSDEPTAPPPELAPDLAPVPESELVVPQLAVEVDTGPVTSIARGVRRRRRRRGGLGIPLACGGLLLLAITVAWVLNDPTRFQGQLSGSLVAGIVDADDSLTGVAREIPAELVAGSAETYAALAERLRENPEGVFSNVMTVTFDESDGQVVVRLEASGDLQLVRVRLDDSDGLRRFAESQAASLNARRLAALAEDFKKLLDEWQAAGEADESFDGWADFRISVGLAALTGGVGFHAVAVTGRQELRCVYEADRALYFLVPASLSSFTLKGRRMPDGSVPFPADFTVTISAGR